MYICTHTHLYIIRMLLYMYIYKEHPDFKWLVRDCLLSLREEGAEPARQPGSQAARQRLGTSGVF